MEIIGLVLGGGKSSRMKQDKLLLPWQEKTLWEEAESKLRQAGIERVYISAPKHVNLPENTNVVFDITKEAGPVGGIQAVCNELQGQSDFLLLVLPVDMPCIDSSFLLKLISQTTFLQESCYAVSLDQFYFPCLLSVNAKVKEKIHSFITKSWHMFLQDINVKYMPIQESEEALFLNINEAKEYQSLYAKMKASTIL